MRANNRIRKKYQRLLAVGRQFTHLARVKGSVVTGLHALKEIAGTEHDAVIKGLEQVFFGQASADDKQMQKTIGPYATLNRLVIEINKERGDPIKALGKFENLLQSVNEESRALWLGASGLIFYLFAVLLIALVVSSIAIIYVLPQFQGMFSAAHAKLPALTQLVLSGNGLVLASVYALLGLLMFALMRGVLHVFDVISRLQPFEKTLRIPFLAPLCKTYNRLLAMNFTRLLMVSGVAQEKSLSLAADLANDKALAGLAGPAGRKLPWQKSDVLDAIALAKDAGNIEAELDYQINDVTYQLANEFAIVREKTLLFLHVLVAVVVGLFVIAMYLPIFRMGEIA